MDYLNITALPAFLMFRNKLNPTPESFTSHFYRDLLVPWMWNKITPPFFDYNYETLELSRNQRGLP